MMHSASGEHVPSPVQKRKLETRSRRHQNARHVAIVRTAALVLLLAWAAAALWPGVAELKMGRGRLCLANAMPATVHSNSRPQSAGSVNHRTSAA